QIGRKIRGHKKPRRSAVFESRKAVCSGNAQFVQRTPRAFPLLDPGRLAAAPRPSLVGVFGMAITHYTLRSTRFHTGRNRQQFVQAETITFGNGFEFSLRLPDLLLAALLQFALNLL